MGGVGQTGCLPPVCRGWLGVGPRAVRLIDLTPPVPPATFARFPAGYPNLVANVGRGTPTVDDNDYNTFFWPQQFGRIVINADDAAVASGCGGASPPPPTCNIYIAVFGSVPDRSLFILTAIVTSEVLVDGQPLLSHSDYLVRWRAATRVAVWCVLMPR